MGFRLKHKRSLGDCTEVYSMSFSAGMTVHEFIDAVLKKKEWGFVSFDNVKGSIWYDNGKITDGNIDKFMDTGSRLAVLMVDGPEWTTVLSLSLRKVLSLRKKQKA